MKYRSKPVDVEAVQYREGSSYLKMYAIWGLRFTDVCKVSPFMKDMIVQNWGWCKFTDWIIKDGDTFSVCSDDEFRRKYEAV